jgi:hypothetical protein
VGITGLAGSGLLLFLAAFTSNSNLCAACLVASNAFFSFGVMVSYAVCTDIGKTMPAQ